MYFICPYKYISTVLIHVLSKNRAVKYVHIKIYVMFAGMCICMCVHLSIYLYHLAICHLSIYHLSIYISIYLSSK